MHPACPNKKQNHLQNSFLRRAQFWVRKTFSKPASLKRASLVREPSILHLPTSFPKQILTPSRFKLILLINNGIDWKDHNSCSFWAENFSRSLEGQGDPQGAVKYSIQSFKWKPATCAQTHKLRNNKKHFKQSPIRLQKADAPSFSSKQSSHQTKRNNKKLPSTGFKQQPICTPLAPTRNKIIFKTASSDGPNSGSGKHSQNRLRSKGPP